MKKPILFIAAALLSLALQAQKRNAYIDSLARLLATTRGDTQRVKLYHNIAQAYNLVDPGTAMAYADSGVVLAEKANWKRGIGSMHQTRGNILNDQGRGEEALREYELAYALAKDTKDAVAEAGVLIDIGGFYYRTSDFVKAIDYYTRALDIAIPLHHNNVLGSAYCNLASVYYSQSNYARSIEYNNKALVEFQKLGNRDKIARTLNDLGNNYFGMGNKSQARVNYRKALAIYDSTNNNTGRAILYSQIAILSEPNYYETIAYQEKSQAIWDSINPTHFNSIVNLGNMGESYLNLVRNDSISNFTTGARKKLLDKAAGYINRAIKYSQETNNKDNYGYLSGILAEQQELSGDLRSAIANYKLSYAIYDSLFSQENKNKIAAIENKRELSLRDKEIQINRLALSGERKTRIAMIGGILLLLVIGSLLYWQSRTRKKNNTVLLQLNNELDEANKIKARFFAILSHDLRSPVANLISFLELQQDDPNLMSAEQAAAHQQTITASARSLLETMETMLLWSKGQMEQFKPDLRAVRVSDLFNQLQKTFAPVTRAQLFFQDAGTAEVYTDENYLQTIMHNLTVNALKALGDKNEGRIEWTLRVDGNKTVLSITDNGPGMSDEQAHSLYDDAVVSNARSGFGLHLIRDLAKAIHCRISWHSTPGEGTTFTLQT